MVGQGDQYQVVVVKQVEVFVEVYEWLWIEVVRLLVYVMVELVGEGGWWGGDVVEGDFFVGCLDWYFGEVDQV